MLTDDTEQSAAPRKRGMTPIRVTLAAGVEQRFGIEGDWIACVTAPVGVTDLQARFDESELVPLPGGLGFRRYYKQVTLYSATGGAFVCLAGFGSVADARATANVTVNTTVAPGASLNNGGDVACVSGVATVLLAADATRLYALVANSSANAATVRLGTAAVGAATGIPIEPGQTLPIATTAAIYGFQASGGPVTLSAFAVRV
jgi:hypothetical protein